MDRNVLEVIGCLTAGSALVALSGCTAAEKSEPTPATGERSPSKSPTFPASKSAMASKLTSRTEYIDRRELYSIAEIEALLGPPRRLRGVYVFRTEKSFLFGPGESADVQAPYGPSGDESRRYSVDEMTDLIIRYRSCDAALKESYELETSGYDFEYPYRIRLNDRLRLSDKRKPVNKEYVNKKYDDMVLAEMTYRSTLDEKRSACLSGGYEDLVVYQGAKLVRMTHAERRAAWLDEGENWMREGNPFEAARCFEEAAKVEPTSEQALWKAAVAHAAAGRKDQANAALQRFRATATAEQQAQATQAMEKLATQINALP